jgi:uncharacterized membrane protein YesL
MRSFMKKQRLVKRVLMFLTTVGTVATLILFGTAMVHYALDPQHYTEGFLPLILIPFDATIFVTALCGVIAYLMAGEHGHK